MKILAVETATEACSAALHVDGETIHRYQLAPRKHTQLILPMVDALLAEAAVKVFDLDAVAFGRGPGSFTGVRIATGIIQGIAFGADLPVVPVSTLAALAQQGMDEFSVKHVFSAMDARMGEIYWAEYYQDAQGYAQLSGLESVLPAREISSIGQQGYGIGSAWKVYAAELTQKLKGNLMGYNADFLPSAEKIALLAVPAVLKGATVSVEQAMPVYLRDKVAKKQSER